MKHLIPQSSWRLVVEPSASVWWCLWWEEAQRLPWVATLAFLACDGVWGVRGGTEGGINLLSELTQTHVWFPKHKTERRGSGLTGTQKEKCRDTRSIWWCNPSGTQKEKCRDTRSIWWCNPSGTQKEKCRDTWSIWWCNPSGPSPHVSV